MSKNLEQNSVLRCNCKADAPLENCKGLRCDSRLSLVVNTFTSEMKEHISTASLLPL